MELASGQPRSRLARSRTRYRFSLSKGGVAITGKPTAPNLPNGWRVKKSADVRTLIIARMKGMMIFVK